MPRDFPAELRKGTAFLGLNMDPLARDAADEIERLQTALRRIVSLAEKNVPKYAQEIAREALKELGRCR